MLALRHGLPRGAGLMQARVTPRLALYLTLPPLLWAGNAVVGRLMVGQVPPLTLNWLRWVITLVLLLPLGWRVLVPFSRVAARWPYLLALGVLGVGLFNSLQYLALVTSTPLNVTLVATSMPVWMLGVGALFYGEHPTRRQWIGAGLGLVGVLIVISRGSPAVLAQVQFVPGDLLMLLAIVGWAFYSWLLARPPASMRGEARPTAQQGWDWAGLLLVQVIFGCLAASVFTLGEQTVGAAPIRWGWGVVAALAYISLAASIVAYRCWGLGVAQGGPALASIFNNLTPLFAALLSGFALGQWPQPYHAVAFVLILAGIVVGMGRTAGP
jgi:drug/metabolite transporter (DMT)-like permease